MVNQSTLHALGLQSSQPSPRYIVGDTVEVLRASRLPAVEEVLGCGVVQRVTGEFPNQLYWIEGFAMARDARTLRLVLRGSR